MHKQITLVGNFGATNIGDEAILESSLQLLRKKFTEPVDLHILSHNPKHTEHLYEEYNVSGSVFIPFGFGSLIRNTIAFCKSWKKLASSNIVVFPGGGLWTDAHSLYAILLWTLHFVFFKVVLNKPVYLYGQTIGPVRSWLGKVLTKFVLNNAKVITVRDKESSLEIEHLFEKDRPKFTESYDPALLIDIPELPKQEEKDALHIALSLRPWKDQEEKLIEMLVKVFQSAPFKKQNVHLHLIPMQTIKEEDVTILHKAKSKLHGEHIKVKVHAALTYVDVLEIVQNCSFVIGMRLHFIILSLLLHKPAIALSYSSKVRGFMKHFDLEEYVFDLHSDLQDSKKLSDLCKGLLVKKTQTELSEKIAKKLQTIRKKKIYTGLPNWK